MFCFRFSHPTSAVTRVRYYARMWDRILGGIARIAVKKRLAIRALISGEAVKDQNEGVTLALSLFQQPLGVLI